MLVIEGILPFLYPQKWRAMLQRISATEDSAVRITGLMTMVLGVGLLYILS